MRVIAPVVVLLTFGLVWGIAGQIPSHRHLIGTIVYWGVTALIPLLFGLLILSRASGSTRIDSQGLHTRTVWRRRDYSWAQIEHIDTSYEFGIGNSITRVRITRSDGRRRKLPFPFDSHSRTGDPDFDLKLAQLRRAWEAGRRSAGRPGDRHR